MPDLHVVQRPQLDYRLGRQVVHDPRSRAFAAPRGFTRPTKRFRHALYDPLITPNQTVGCCTGVAEAVMGNVKGNRIKRQVLKMDTALRIYSRATELDPFQGVFPPTDTGSSGLAAAKAAIEQGIGWRYDWCFGIDHLLDTLRTHPVSVGTWWRSGMFDLDDDGYLNCTGPYVGGHQWVVRGYDPKMDTLDGVCWWGLNWPKPLARGRFKIRRSDLATLLADDGDAHVTYRA